MLVGGRTDWQTDQPTDRPTVRQTNREAGSRHADGQTDRLANMLIVGHKGYRLETMFAVHGTREAQERLWHSG